MSSHQVAIIGAGAMGHGFALHFVLNDQDVILIDHKDENLQRAEEQIKDTVAFLNESDQADADPKSVVSEIEFTLDAHEGVSNADIVLETVTEELSTKQELFADIVDSTPDDAVLSSNTSGIPISDIAEAAPEEAHRFVGCHWWYPPYLLRPVEVIKGDRTSEQFFEKMANFIEAVDREPIVVEKDVPGFVWNRVQHAVIRECLHLVEEGVASIEDINVAIRDGYATRTAAIGPFETMDIAGLDLVKTVSSELYPHLDDDDEPSELFDEFIEDGRGGTTDGAGFFEYDQPHEEITHARDEKVVAIQRALDHLKEE